MAPDNRLRLGWVGPRVACSTKYRFNWNMASGITRVYKIWSVLQLVWLLKYKNVALMRSTSSARREKKVPISNTCRRFFAAKSEPFVSKRAAVIGWQIDTKEKSCAWEREIRVLYPLFCSPTVTLHWPFTFPLRYAPPTRAYSTNCARHALLVLAEERKEEEETEWIVTNGRWRRYGGRVQVVRPPRAEEYNGRQLSGYLWKV